MQVLKGRLSVHQPTVMCDGFVCEEGEDLDQEELQANAANLPKTLQSLPGMLLVFFSSVFRIVQIRMLRGQLWCSLLSFPSSLPKTLQALPSTVALFCTLMSQSLQSDCLWDTLDSLQFVCWCVRSAAQLPKYMQSLSTM